MRSLSAKASEVNANFDALLTMINDLKAENENLKARIKALEDSDVLAMNEFLEVYPNPSQMPLDTGTQGPMIRFTGVNVQVVDGTGATYHIDGDGRYAPDLPPSGLGNLVIGYDAARSSNSEKTGSHNLIIGDEHNYTSYGGLVAGNRNTISHRGASVSGGEGNIASDLYSSVSGGSGNKASSRYSSVSGGEGNKASELYSSVSGGEGNKASGPHSSVSGGRDNEASDWYSSVSGGSGNKASNEYSSVSGGKDNETRGLFSSISGGERNKAHSPYSSILGGEKRETEAPRQTIP